VKVTPSCSRPVVFLSSRLPHRFWVYAPNSQHIQSLHPSGPRPHPHRGHNDRGLHRQRNAGDQSLPAVPSQIECLSDVCTADGLKIDPGLQVQPSTVTSQSTIKWPRQALSGPRSQMVWRRFLWPYTRAFATKRLRQILGTWKHPDLEFGLHTTIHQSKCSDRWSQQATALHGTASTSWQYLLAVPSTRNPVHAPIPYSVD
jgi:hypothetical protein